MSRPSVRRRLLRFVDGPLTPFPYPSRMDRIARLSAALAEGRHDDFLRELDAALRVEGYSEAGREAGLDASTVRRAVMPGRNTGFRTLNAMLGTVGLTLAVVRKGDR